MKKIILLTLIICSCVSTLTAGPVNGYVLVNGEQLTAEYTLLGNGKVALGSGQNACIPQYTVGRVCVPEEVSISGTTYQVTAVSALAFRFCTQLTYVEIQEGVERIGNFAFVGCNSITEIVLPSTLKSIGSGAFINLPLKKITCNAVEPPVWEYNDVFYFHEGGIGDSNPRHIGSIRLIVPEESVAKYMASQFSNADLGWTTPEGWGNYTGYNDEFYKTYHVYTPEDLNALQQFINIDDERIENIVLEADIDMADYRWTKGIGSVENPFSGNFDGQGHTIRNLHVEPTDNSAAGLFSHFAGEEIKNLRIVRCGFRGSSAGALVGYKHRWATISNVYVSLCSSYGKSYAGGLIGRSWMDLTFDKCYIDGVAAGFLGQSELKGMGGLVGASEGSMTATNCAVALSLDNIEGKSGPFVGIVNDKKTATVDYSYYAGDEFGNYEPEAHRNVFGEHVIIAEKTPLTWNGEARTFNEGNLQSFMPVSVLGLDNWVYKVNEFPMPDCFEDVWDVEVNTMTLRPASLTSPRINALSPVGDIPTEAWLTNARGVGYEYYEYTTSKLWIDEKINTIYGSYSPLLPIGKGKITATDGVIYDRTLKARDNGMVDIIEPTFEEDGEGHLVLDENGDPIPDGGEQVVGQKPDYLPVGYSIYLPYTAKLSPFCKLYQPRKVISREGETIAVFREVEGNQVEAYKPYYVIVEKESIPLSTESESVCPVMTDNTISLGNYDFVGTRYQISNIRASEASAYILQSDGKWHLVSKSNSNAYIPAFRAYFVATGTNNASALRISFVDIEATGVSVASADKGTQSGSWYTLDGRRLTLPAGTDARRALPKGIYINNGKKVVVR